MAKENNLKDFLTDVADAIREKKGTTDLINPQDFSAEIASIETGGGGFNPELLEGFIPLQREFSDEFNNDFAR